MVVKNRKKTRRVGRWKKGETGNPLGRPKGVLNKTTREVRDLCRGLVEGPKYQKWLASQLEGGKLAPQLQQMIWYYAYGKPIQAVDVNMNFDPAKYLARDEEAPID